MVHNYYSGRGGEDVSTESEIKLLRDNGHEVRVYTKNNKNIQNLRGIQLIRVAWKTVWNHRVYRDLIGLIREFKPDVVHFQNTFPQISPSAYWACRKEGVPVVQTLHNYRLLCPSGILFHNGKIYEKNVGKLFPFDAVLNKVYRNSFLATFVLSLMLFFHRIIGTYSNKVDIYLAVSDFVRKKYIRAGFSSNQIVVKRNFVFDGKKRKASGEYALFFGRLSSEKGIFTLLNAWKNINYELRIAGEGPLKRETEEFIQNNNIRCVKLLGALNGNEVKKALNGCKFVIVPSEWYEPAARTIIESFSQGIPVVASNIGGNSELVKDNYNGFLFEAGNVRDLKNKVNLLIRDGGIFKKTGENAFKSYVLNYSSDKNYADLIKIYKSLLSKQEMLKNG